MCAGDRANGRGEVVQEIAFGEMHTQQLGNLIQDNDQPDPRFESGEHGI